MSLLRAIWKAATVRYEADGAALCVFGEEGLMIDNLQNMEV